MKLINFFYVAAIITIIIAAAIFYPISSYAVNLYYETPETYVSSRTITDDIGKIETIGTTDNNIFSDFYNQYSLPNKLYSNNYSNDNSIIKNEILYESDDLLIEDGIEENQNDSLNINISAISHEPKPFTPEGQATIVDLVNENDGKEFYTFKTPSDNVFYLIIDHQRNSDNVYFLNAVTEQDLLALVKKDKKSDSEKSVSAIPTLTTPSESEKEKIDEPPEQPHTIPAQPPVKEPYNNGMIIFILIGCVIFGGVAYYIKIVRPKQQIAVEEDDDNYDNITDDEDNYELTTDDENEIEFVDEPEIIENEINEDIVDDDV